MTLTEEQYYSNEFQVRVKSLMSSSFNDIDDYLRRCHPPMDTMRMPLDDILASLTQVLKPIILTIYVEELGRFGIQGSITDEYYEANVEFQIDKITYAYVSGCSKYMLGQLLFYVDRSFIFQFLKNSIVRPNLKNIIDEVREVLCKKTEMGKEIEQADKLGELINDAVFAYMISTDLEKFETCIKEINELEVKNKDRIINATIEASKFVVPKHVEDIIYDINRFNPEVNRKFLFEYNRIHTRDKLRHYLEDYVGNKFDMNTKIDLTKLERDAYNNAIPTPEIDGLTYDERHLAKRILDQSDDRLDYDRIKHNPTLMSIKKILIEFKNNGDIVRVVENVMSIRDKNDKLLHEFNICTGVATDEINDDYYMFGKAAGIVRKRTEDKTSVLFATGITKEEERNILYGRARDISKMSPHERVQHRRNKIHELRKLLEFAGDHSLNEQIGYKIKGHVSEVIYNKGKIDDRLIVMEDPFALLNRLVEIEGLYVKLVQGDDPIKEMIRR